jgi:hypothetical protein
MKNLVFLFLLVFSAQILGQGLQFKFNQDINVSNGKEILKNPWAGGLNAAQFSQIDLNGDGIEDVLAFDRTNQKVFTYINKSIIGGAIALAYDPMYEKNFPLIENWLIVCDFDGDRRKDLFTSTSAGVKVYRNISGGANIKFEVVSDALFSEGFSGKINLYVAASDIPAIGDLDGDGDIDILSFEPGGHYLEFHKNMSIEKTGQMGLQFQKLGDCWGNFIHNDCRDILFGVPCNASGNSSVALHSNLSPYQTMHTGNSLNLLDLNKDGIKDLLFGHVTCSNLVYMPNTGSLNQANFLKAEFDYPTKNPVSVPSFAAAFPLDLNGDGQVELLTSTNAADNGGYIQDFQNSVSLFQFEKGDWVLKSKNYLQSEMIDVGEGASCIWWDGDQDGDLDLYVGNAGIRGPVGVRASIFYFENVGSSFKPELIFKTDDFGGLSKLIQGTDIRLSLADLVSSGRRQLILSIQTFLGPELRYFSSNTSVSNQYKLAGLSSGDRPLFTDWNQDGQVDLLVLEKSGRIRSYDRSFSKILSSDWGGFSKKTEWVLQSFALADGDLDGRLDFIGIDNFGRLHVGILDPITSLIFWQSDANFESFNFGQKATVSASDWNQDGLMDISVGLSTGGVQLLQNKSMSELSSNVENSFIQIWPNPSKEYVQIMTNESGTYEVIDFIGKKILAIAPIEKLIPSRIDVSRISKGVYFLKFTSSKNQISLRKLVVD